MDKISEISRKKSRPYAIKSANQLAIKDVDLGKRIVTGFYNTCNFFDSDNDVALPGVNNKSIAERGPNSSSVCKIKHLAFHDWDKQPGKILTLEERTINGITGTYFETKMSNTTLGNDTLINYQEGIIDNHSEGFRYQDGELIEQGDENWNKYLSLLINPEDAEKVGHMFIWRQWKMYEGSNVAFGANELTPYLGVKSGNKDALLMKLNERIDLLGKQVKGGTQSDETLETFEMQILQLKQIIKEVFEVEPSAKDILIKNRLEGDTKPKFDISQAIKTSKIL